MKIFWSWQSDTPGNIGRHFVRETLEIALKELNEEPTEVPTIEESERLELEHDRKGIPGSPDLVSTILKKIEDSAVFIADVTPVGKGVNERALLNPNVAIELGYALAKVGDEGLLMVLNSSFGDRESLPFDLRHKAGPIMFNLGANASKEERKRVQLELTQTLKAAIRDCLRQAENRPSATHEEIPFRSNVAQYFDDGEVLDEREGTNGSIQLSCKPGPLLYLRIIPMRVMQRLRESDIKDLVYGINLQPLAAHVGGGACWGRNRYGGITYSFTHEADVGHILTSSQVFHNREIWGLDATLFDKSNRCIRSMEFEKKLDAGFRHYLKVARERLDLGSPLVVEAGAVRVEGFRMAMGIDYVPSLWAPVHKKEIISRQKLGSFEDSEINRVLLAIFEDFFDAAGERRPGYFRGFPPIDNSGSAGT
ncbi:MAG: hypothetical protein HZA13_03140 [Nitrospirae bacterium]|nr:hypothetical protein [Nitrospirota bacterium]